MREFPSADQDFNLWYLMGMTRGIIFKARQRELERYDITLRQAAVLSTVKMLGGEATLAEIPRWFFWESHSISEPLSRVEGQGLVSNVKDLERKNRVRVGLTEKGRQAWYQSIKRESMYKIMTFQSDEERKQLRSCLQKL